MWRGIANNDLVLVFLFGLSLITSVCPSFCSLKFCSRLMSWEQIDNFQKELYTVNHKCPKILNTKNVFTVYNFRNYFSENMLGFEILECGHFHL